MEIGSSSAPRFPRETRLRVVPLAASSAAPRNCGELIALASQPASIRSLGLWTNDTDIDDRNAALRDSGKYAGPPNRVGHARDEHVTSFKKGASQLFGLRFGQEPRRLVDEAAIPNVCELDESNDAIWVLVLRFNPVAVRKNTIADELL